MSETNIKFTAAIARKIALKSLLSVVDCMMSYSDSGYTFDLPADHFEQNFEEDLEEKGIHVTERRIRICSKHYEKEKAKFEKLIRSRYHDNKNLNL